MLSDGRELTSLVYKAGHHGAKASSNQAFLDAVRPQIMVVSAGAGNRFGHPHEDVMQRLLSSGVSIHQTATEGALTLAVTSEGGLDISGHRQGYQPWWM